MRRAVFKYLFSADAVPSLNSSCILLCICQTCADILQKLFQAENTAKKFLLLVSGIRRKCPFGRFHQAADHSGECLSSVFCDLQVISVSYTHLTEDQIYSAILLSRGISFYLVLLLAGLYIIGLHFFYTFLDKRKK